MSDNEQTGGVLSEEESGNLRTWVITRQAELNSAIVAMYGAETTIRELLVMVDEAVKAEEGFRPYSDGLFVRVVVEQYGAKEIEA